MRPSAEQARAELAARLKARGPEIEEAAMTRVYAVSGPEATADPEYAEGLRAAIFAALEYGLAALNQGSERSPSIPAVLLTQARLAARNRVSLDTVLRRYFAGYTLLGDFLVEEAEAAGIYGTSLKRLLRGQASRFDSLIKAVADEHARALPAGPGSAEDRRAELIQCLLEGELVDASELAYDLDGCHLGAIVAGPGAEEAFRGLVDGLDCRALIVPRAEATVWGWLGARHRIDLDEIERLVAEKWPSRVVLALGEPAPGPGGWRLSHQQAAAALPIAVRAGDALTRYADVALFASILQDDLLTTTLRQLYLAPLERHRDRGRTLRETLSAYFAADRNISSAAVALGVNRNTVTSRLRSVEASVGRPLGACEAELEAAIRLDDRRNRIASLLAAR
jgi:PucR C-terminal helix-turn-helix domain/GGDEF-like domain